MGSLALRALDSAAGQRIKAAGQTGFDASAALVASAVRPCRVGGAARRSQGIWGGEHVRAVGRAAWLSSREHIS